MSLGILTDVAFSQSHRYLGLDWSMVTIVGLIGNAIFSSRFIVQWIASERQATSVIPVSFWYLSLIGSVTMAVYFVARRDPVGILAYLPNSLVYLRNLQLIRLRAGSGR